MVLWMIILSGELSQESQDWDRSGMRCLQECPWQRRPANYGFCGFLLVSCWETNGTTGVSAEPLFPCLPLSWGLLCALPSGHKTLRMPWDSMFSIQNHDSWILFVVNGPAEWEKERRGRQEKHIFEAWVLRHSKTFTEIWLIIIASSKISAGAQQRKKQRRKRWLPPTANLWTSEVANIDEGDLGIQYHFAVNLLWMSIYVICVKFCLWGKQESDPIRAGSDIVSPRHGSSPVPFRIW